MADAPSGMDFQKGFKPGGYYGSGDDSDASAKAKPRTDHIMKYLNKSIEGYKKTEEKMHKQAGEHKELAMLAEQNGHTELAEKYWLKMEAEELAADKAAKSRKDFQDLKDFRQITAKLGDGGVAVWNFLEQDINGGAKMLTEFVISTAAMVPGLLDKLAGKLKEKGKSQQEKQRAAEALNETNSEVYDTMRDSVSEASRLHGDAMRQELKDYYKNRVTNLTKDLTTYRNMNYFQYELNHAPEEQVRMVHAELKMAGNDLAAQQAVMEGFIKRQEERPLRDRFNEQILNYQDPPERAQLNDFLQNSTPEKGAELMKAMINVQKNKFHVNTSQADVAKYKETHVGKEQQRRNHSNPGHSGPG